MAIFIPSFNQVKHKMTAGEKRVAEILRTQLDDACMVWYDIPVGKKRRYPRFCDSAPTSWFVVFRGERLEN